MAARARVGGRQRQREASRLPLCDSHNDVYLAEDGTSYMKGAGARRAPCADRPHARPTAQQEALLRLTYEQPGLDRDLARRKLVDWAAAPRARVYVGIGSERQFGCPDEDLVSVIHQRLGAGSLGEVYDACTPDGCGFVVKVQRQSRDPRADPGQREVAMSRLITADRKSADIIVPILGARACGGLFLTLSPKWDMDGEKLGAAQYEAEFKLPATPEGCGQDVQMLLYTESQLRQFFLLARRLTALGVAHGDLKPDNYLYKIAEDRLAVTDLGFAGKFGTPYPPLWGFSRNDAHCEDDMTPEAARYANTWQILFRFATYRAVLVAVGDPARRPLDLRLFAGLSADFARDLPDAARAAIAGACGAVQPDVARGLRAASRDRAREFAHLPPYYLTDA
jgi:hypothetical protein